MASQGYSPGPGIPSPSNGSGTRLDGFLRVRSSPRYALHFTLLILTLITSTAMGARMALNFHLNRAPFDLGRDWRFWETLAQPSLLAWGLPFSLTLLLILLAHEFGHYLTCRYYGVDATLPYFMPAPTLFGTAGAFIRIKSPIYSKQVLFDVGIAGPLAGFVFLVPVLAAGLAYSKIVQGIEGRGDLVFGMPPLLWLLEKAVFPGISSADIYLHPVARAAWVGMFATALNLLPIGQLDGGHILYSFAGQRHRGLSRAFALALFPLGLITRYWPWYIWAALLLFFGLRHPAIFDAAPLTGGRKALAAIAAAIFLLCFMAVPVATP